ncbi:hypothetical protein D3C84_942030 [compost metagenome]
MLTKDFLDFCWIDVLSAANNHVLDPVGQVQEALVIKIASITRGVPTVYHCLLRLARHLPIAGHQRRGLDPDFAVLAPDQYLAIRSTDFQAHAC